MIIPWLSGCVHEVIMLDRYWTWICGWTRLRLCGCTGALSRTRRTLKTRCLYFRYNFHTSIYWHSLLALHSTYEWQPFCHFVFSRSKSWWHRQNVFAHDELASVKHLIISSFFLAAKIINSFTLWWHLHTLLIPVTYLFIPPLFPTDRLRSF
jgi:hypothetical protein